MNTSFSYDSNLHSHGEHTRATERLVVNVVKNGWRENV